MSYELVTLLDVSVDTFFFPNKETDKSTQRRQLDSLLDEVSDQGLRIVTATAKEILSLAPDGVLLSNGPGDPADNKEEIAVLAELAGRVPIFGICLGHQLLALALKYGHRGVNQPATDLVTGRTYMTSQNHGYAVVADSIPGVGSVWFRNANDGTCEGVDYPALRAFSVQFHPEAHAGPLDTAFLFDRFIGMMEET